MRKVSKALATLLAVCLLFTGAMSIFADSTSPIPSSSYKRPDMSIKKIKSDITLDGDLEAAWKNEATKIEFTRSALKSSGILWNWTGDDGVSWGPDTNDGEGTAYIGWTEDFILFALEVKDAENTNNQVKNNELWKGDCLQMQIGADASRFGSSEDVEATGVQRYEFGFALSSLTKRGLGFKWFPTEGDLPAARKQAVSAINSNLAYYIKSAGGKTTYEVALRYDSFGRTSKMSANDVIPFSFALHLYKDPAQSQGENDNGWFLEWARGVSGSDQGPNTANDDPYFGVKNIGSAARLTLSDGNGPIPTSDKPTTPTSNKPTTPTSNKPTTPSSNGGNKTTPSSNGGNNTPSNNGNGNGNVTAAPSDSGNPNNPGTPDNPGNPDNPDQPTAAPTTTTTAPEVEGVNKYYNDQDATDVDDADILSAIKAQLDADEITIPAENTMVVKAYVPGEAKFAIPMSDVEAIYAKDGDNYKKLTGEDFKDADGNDTGWYVFDVSDLEEGATVYVVKSIAPTTTVATTTNKAVDATTKAGTTTKAGDEAKGGSHWWIWLIVVVLVLAVAGVIVFFVLKKKNEEDDTDGFDSDNGDDTSSEE